MSASTDALEPAARGRVVVGMSGGVDSSVVAALLQREGYEVVGVSMRLYATSAGAGRSCCSPDDIYDARAVAAERGFPFYVASYQELFRERIIDRFVDDYRRGRTPSPCILCNDHLKFEALLERMEAFGGSFLATGHYARLKRRGGRWALLRGVDQSKDQSYFLFGLRRAVLGRVRFPLGGWTKAEVRSVARELDLVTAEKAESQDLCFIGAGSYGDFVEQRLPDGALRAGDIVRESTGEVLGRHAGVHRFTVGQRRGLGIGHTEPLYVKGIDAEAGRVRVGTAAEARELRFTIDGANWLRWDRPPAGFEAEVQLRYRHRPVDGHVAVDPGDSSRAVVTLVEGELGVAPGQAAVFYEGDEVLGGGWIEVVG